ncbi:MAG: dihydropteroate synthase [Verrucomicrobiae bacterium]|nr:dihydropteroate synthase [Verrucomicrobiae bacterium]
MGIVNVTPDSFSDGGRYFSPDRACQHAETLWRAGADILDVGGESTRPGADPVPAEEEWRRIEPVITWWAATSHLPDCPRPKPWLSVDTTKAVVAERALDAGAHIINDISALRFDPDMVGVVRGAGAGVVLMHMQGTPQTMQVAPHYEDVVREVRAFLADRVAWAIAHGIAREQIAIDPGIGFGKTLDHNLELLAHMETFTSLGCPLLLGASRKSFIGKLTGREPADRTAGSLAVVAWAILHRARVLRVHDVAETRDVITLITTLQRYKSCPVSPPTPVG